MELGLASLANRKIRLNYDWFPEVCLINKQENAQLAYLINSDHL